MLSRLKKNAVFRFFSSLKLAVILLIALAIILAIATFYESLYDTKTAQYLVYRSPLFAVFLTTLGLNVTCSTLMRYPWKKSQTGFVLTHLGIITILIGSLQTMFIGVDGSMALEEGETSAKVTIDEPVLYFGRDIEMVREIPAEFRWNRPEPGRSAHRFRVDPEGQITAVIDNYYHHALSEAEYVEDPEGIPALSLRLKNEQVDQTLWLTPAEGSTSLGPASIEFFRLPNEQAVQEFLAPADPQGRGTLQILLEDRPLVVDLDRLGEEAYPLEYEDATLQLIRYLPHAVVEDGALTTRTQNPVNPAVEVILSTPSGNQTWLLFAALPELNTRIDSSGKDFQSRLLYSRADREEGVRLLEIGLAPDHSLLYRIDGEKSGSLEVGSPIPTGWMDLTAEVATFLPKAKREKKLREMTPKKGQEDKAPGPAIRVTLEGAEDPGPYWLERGDILRIPDGSNQDIILGYGYKTVPLDFAIELKEFRIGYDPGTKTPATYESDIVVDGKPYTVAMNEPYEQDGYKVFQASYSETADGRMISVFAVAKDPGIVLKYLGSIIMILGIIIMFYFKPKKARRDKDVEGSEESTVA